MNTATLTDVPINSIELKATGNYRRTFVGLEELAESIKDKGIVQPLVLRTPEKPGGKYRLVCGERCGGQCE